MGINIHLHKLIKVNNKNGGCQCHNSKLIVMTSTTDWERHGKGYGVSDDSSMRKKKSSGGGAEEEREMQSSQNERDRSHVGMIVVTVAAAV